MNRYFLGRFINLNCFAKRNINILHTQNCSLVNNVSNNLRPESYEPHALDFVGDDLSDFQPSIHLSYNLAAYANHSDTLQKLLELNVDLYKIEKNVDIPQDILKLDFEKNIQPYLIFLLDYVDDELLGWFITKNPRIFFVKLDDLEVRINYLKSKQFSNDQIKRIVSKNPEWLNYSTIEIDERLGHYQKMFKLSGAEVRLLTTTNSRFITYSKSHIHTNTFVITEEMGFYDQELKKLLLKLPKLWMLNQLHLLRRFKYLHNIVKIPHKYFISFPHVLLYREHIVKARHKFLQELGRDQFDPHKTNYVPITALVEGTDEEFCKNYAKCSERDFNVFQKSI